MQWLRKYLLSWLIFFMLCPKRSLTTEDNETNYVSNGRGKSSKEFIQNHKLHMQLSEPGFNYTDEEMKKLKIWPRGIIPYFIDDFSFDKTLRERLRSLLNSFNSITGLEFFELSRVPDSETKRWLFFLNRRGVLNCEDYTTDSFTTTGVQRVVLGYDCFASGGGELASTILALAGVPPQHNAPDRDDHITVFMDNIIPEKRKLFQVLKNDEWLFHHVTYDFLSAGHYNFHKYTINGSATIIPKDNANLKIAIGEGNGISPKDIWKIRMMYNFISNDRSKLKSSDCSKMFKPWSEFSVRNPVRQDVIIPRIKPAKYLGLPDEDEVSKENQNQKLHKKLQVEKPLPLKKDRPFSSGKNRPFPLGKQKLDYLSDQDMNEDDSGGRVKLLAKMKGFKKRAALHSKFHQQLSKLSVMSDFDTDKNNK